MSSHEFGSIGLHFYQPTFRSECAVLEKPEGFKLEVLRDLFPHKIAAVFVYNELDALLEHAFEHGAGPLTGQCSLISKHVDALNSTAVYYAQLRCCILITFETVRI